MSDEFDCSYNTNWFVRQRIQYSMSLADYGSIFSFDFNPGAAMAPNKYTVKPKTMPSRCLTPEQFELQEMTRTLVVEGNPLSNQQLL